jgi:STAM-binding protein
VPAILNQNGSYGSSTPSLDGSTNINGDMQSVLSLDDGRWSLPVKEPGSLFNASFEEEFSQLNIRQPSPPPVLAQVHPKRRPTSPSRIVDPRPGLPTCDTGRFQNLHLVNKLKSICSFLFMVLFQIQCILDYYYFYSYFIYCQ